MVGGNTDQVGDREYDLELSRHRTQVVSDYLIAHGVDPQRITVFAYGAAESKSEFDTQDLRRVDIVMTERQPEWQDGIR